MNIVMNRDAGKLIKPLLEPNVRRVVAELELLIKQAISMDQSGDRVRASLVKLLTLPDGQGRDMALLLTNCIALAVENVKTVETGIEQMARRLAGQN